MLKRIYVYLSEMFPPLQRFVLSAGLFFAIYFLILAGNGIGTYQIGVREWVGVLTVFTFLLSLRVADEFKDLDTDMKNFPGRPLPSGRVKKGDLLALLFVFQLPVVTMNLIYMNNLPYLIALYTYGGLMTVWFFAKRAIKGNLVLALVTHNPVQILLNMYVASYVCGTYRLNVWAPTVLLPVVAMYLPGLIWEIGRKIRAPKMETTYTTYSKLWGYKKAVLVIVTLIIIATVLNIMLIGRFNIVAAVLSCAVAGAVIAASGIYVNNPHRFAYINPVMAFIYIQELILIAASYGHVAGWWL